MTEFKIKEISEFVEDNLNKKRVIFSDSEKDMEIILEGEGKIKATVEV